jgi:hypothetical protein
MPVKIKMFTILLLWLTIALTIVFGVQSIVIKIVLICIAVGVTAHIALIKSRRAGDTQR